MKVCRVSASQKRQLKAKELLSKIADEDQWGKLSTDNLVKLESSLVEDCRGSSSLVTSDLTSKTKLGKYKPDSAGLRMKDEHVPICKQIGLLKDLIACTTASPWAVSIPSRCFRFLWILHRNRF